MLSRKPVVVVGSINIDLVASVEHIPVEGETVMGKSFQTHPGGKGANQAVAVGRLGYPVHMIGRLGDDAFGQQLRSHLEECGVEISGVAATKGSSGVATIVVDQDGQNSIVVVPGANAFLTPDDLQRNLDILRSAGVVLAQLEIPMETVEALAGICTQEKIPLILDPAPARELPASLWRHLEWFTPNETEANFFVATSSAADPAQMAQGLIGKGARNVILKMGSSGAHVALAQGLSKSLPAFAVHAIDTTAAGDAFNGAFATGLMLQMDPIESARFASAAAAISVTRPGAQSSMPRMDEVEQVLNSASGAR